MLYPDLDQEPDQDKLLWIQIWPDQTSRNSIGTVLIIQPTLLSVTSKVWMKTMFRVRDILDPYADPDPRIRTSD